MAVADEGAGQPALAEGQERPVPDYDGRGDEPTTAGDVLIWIPRAVLYPIYLFTEYGLRWPLRQLVSWFDSTPTTDPFWTFGPGHKSGILPSAVFDFGFRPSIGAYFYSDDALVDRLGFRAHFGYGGPQWYRATALVRYTLDRGSLTRSEKLVQAKFIYSHRPDWIFYGLGPDSDDGDESRYQAEVFEGTLKYEGGYWRSGQMISWFGVRDVRFQDDTCCGDRSIGEAVEARDIPALPPLFEDGYRVARTGVVLTLDTREPRYVEAPEGSDWEPPSGTGFKLEGHVEFAGGLKDIHLPSGQPTRLGYTHYGGTIGGFWDVYQQRVLGLELFGDFVDPFVEGRPVPFTELVSLGGSRPLRGFLERRLLDRSGLAATLTYSYPIWTLLDGSVHYAVGNVFGEHLEHFDLRLLRHSFGLGFRGISKRDHVFEALLAFGTDTIYQGSKLDTVRVVIGASDDFPLETK